MTNFDFTEKILELLQEKKYVPLQKYLETLNPADIAECMIDLLDEEDLDDKSLLRYVPQTKPVVAQMKMAQEYLYRQSIA